jgi:hypothetical protein
LPTHRLPAPALADTPHRLPAPTLGRHTDYLHPHLADTPTTCTHTWPTHRLPAPTLADTQTALRLRTVIVNSSSQTANSGNVTHLTLGQQLLPNPSQSRFSCVPYKLTASTAKFKDMQHTGQGTTSAT